MTYILLVLRAYQVLSLPHKTDTFATQFTKLLSSILQPYSHKLEYVFRAHQFLSDFESTNK